MGLYSLILLFLGVLVIGLAWANTGQNTVSHHLLFAVILVLFLILFFSLHNHFQQSCRILIASNLDQVIALIRSWGLAAPFMSMLLMITQAIVAPLPAFVITAANGMIFGPFWGTLISLTGALLGALAAFFIARLFGEVAMEKVARNHKTLEFIRHAGEKRGFYVILVSRLLPFISFDFISYLAGLSGIRLRAFIAGTVLGMLPATVVYTLTGYKLPSTTENAPLLLTATVVFVFVLIVFSYAQSRRKKDKL